MRLFGKKKPKTQESSFDMFGGATIKRTAAGYEIAWKGSNPMSVTVSSMPEIESNVNTERDGDTIRITSLECKLKIVTKDGDMKAFISEL